jgi:hypothetical protein
MGRLKKKTYAKKTMQLTAENFHKGVLLDEELMAGVTAHESPGSFVAFVIHHGNAETLLYQVYSDVNEALFQIHALKRNWTFQPFSSGCKGGCKGKSSGSCDGKKACAQKCC